jgi:hypothetical protein
MDLVDQLGHVLGRGELRNAMAQVEYVPRMIAVALEHGARLFAHRCRRRE